MNPVHDRLRAIPSVDELMALPAAARAVERYSRPVVVETIRQEVERYRARLLSTDGQDQGKVAAREGDGTPLDWNARLEAAFSGLGRRMLGPVINATGVVLHTNLGRAPLSRRAIEAVERVSRGYSNLEYDVERGARGSRHDHGDALLRQLTGAEAAMVVNNNAAAVLLVLSALAAGREVILSRGEMIEIGGSFRIPDVMAQSGAKLVEVGTTNRTHLSDYERAIGPETGALLKVHTSNYRVTGFAHAVKAAELAPLAMRHNLYLIEDLGSGVLVETEQFGLAHEPTVAEAVSAGVDAVTFSGDKLLGGPQVGIIAGRKAVVDMCRRHPLARAVRVDKMALAALQATLLDYLHGRALEIPIWRMMAVPQAELKQRAEQVADGIRAELGRDAGPEADRLVQVRVVEGRSAVGGGSLPGETLPTWLVSLRAQGMAPQALAGSLRASDPPVVARIDDDAVLLDLRTVEADDDAGLAQASARALAAFLRAEGVE